MSEALAQLIDILSLEQIGENRYRGIGSSGDGAPGTYGGHFLGQATAAALASVNDERNVHSLHAYFLRSGTPGKAIEYDVETVRDGRAFSSRRVTASQDEKRLFELHASLTFASESSQAINPSAPADFADLPAPESIAPYHELMAALDPVPLPEDWALREHGVDVRIVNAPWVEAGPSTDAGIRHWIRANGRLPQDPKLQHAVLAYQSDESLADNLLIPFDLTWGDADVFCVSLDHAMWFHRPFDLNDWLFVEQRPLSVSHERGVGLGYVWSRERELVASFTQEILLRA